MPSRIGLFPVAAGRGNQTMLYRAFQAMDDLFAPLRLSAAIGRDVQTRLMGSLGQTPWLRRWGALNQLLLSGRMTFGRPDYQIREVLSGNAMVPVREVVALDRPFGNLLHFAKEEGLVPQPKVLVVAPLSGHYSTLLRNTVETLLRDHDVYITDWKTARDVPVSAGTFGFDEYIDYIIDFLRELGPRSHVLAVCQPCVPTLAAVALMAQDKDPCQPRTMTLMGGPVDTRVAPTVVNQLATGYSYEWFKNNLIQTVPEPWDGHGRRVYPGFLQLTAFMGMNMGRHIEQFRRLYQALADAEEAEAAKITEFYEEYFAVLDMTEEFYLETIDKVFQRALLAKGELEHRGRRLDCGAIQRTALLTVEGERDDICAVGQTAAAHLLCTGLRPHLKRHHLQPGVGHYGVFSGSKWERQIYPQVRNLVLAMS